MGRREIRLSYMDIDYKQNCNGTTLEMRNDADLIVYGTDEDMSLNKIAKEQLREVHKYLTKEPGYDEYYDRFDPEFIRDVVDALNDIIEEEK